MNLASDLVTERPELRAYQTALPDLMKHHKGQFAVIRGDRIAGCFDTHDEAMDWAYDEFGLEPFFLKRISEEENVAHFIRDL